MKKKSANLQERIISICLENLKWIIKIIVLFVENTLRIAQI